MRRLFSLEPIFCIALLCGCVSPPPPLSQQELSTVGYGRYPDDYEKIIKDHFAKTLSEADSAQYRFGTPYSGYLQEGPLLGGKIQDAGYFVDVRIKAKDRSGKYRAEKHVGVLIKNGEVLMELTSEELVKVKRGQ